MKRKKKRNRLKKFTRSHPLITLTIGGVIGGTIKLAYSNLNLEFKVPNSNLIIKWISKMKSLIEDNPVISIVFLIGAFSCIIAKMYYVSIDKRKSIESASTIMTNDPNVDDVLIYDKKGKPIMRIKVKHRKESNYIRKKNVRHFPSQNKTNKFEGERINE